MINDMTGIRSYIAYIPKRLAFLKICGVQPYSNEYQYYSELYCEIKGYLNRHKIFKSYILCKIGIEKYKEFYGVSGRTSYRILAKQRANFIKFIEQKEKELLQKYPYENIELLEV
jgi:hypothetical protein